MLCIETTIGPHEVCSVRKLGEGEATDKLYRNAHDSDAEGSNAKRYDEEETPRDSAKRKLARIKEEGCHTGFNISV